MSSQTQKKKKAADNQSIKSKKQEQLTEKYQNIYRTKEIVIL